MKLSLDNTDGKYIISAYEKGEVIVNGKAYRKHLIICPDQLFTDWQMATLAELNIEHFKALLNNKPELILLGTGATFQIPPAKLRADLFQQGVGLEFMDSYAACRTYNILALEERRVAAALII